MTTRLKVIISLLLVSSYAVGDSQLPWAATQRLSDITGFKYPKNWKQLGKWKASKDFKIQVSELPKFYDWRFYADGLTPVKRQRRNDCWAQGTVGVLESLIKIHLQKTVSIAVQEVISCSGKGSAANGGYFAHSYHKQVGAVEEDQFPYVAQDVRCKQGLKPQYKLKDWGYVGGQNRRPQVTEIKQAMMEHGVLGTTIHANGALSSFRGDGVFKGCQNGQTNHIEAIVGWDDTEGGGVWFVRNSWGPTHGENGYAKIPYKCSNVAEMVTWADLDLDYKP